MDNCPYCEATLNSPPTRERNRVNQKPGYRTTGIELIFCPECSRIIDGFTDH